MHPIRPAVHSDTYAPEPVHSDTSAPELRADHGFEASPEVLIVSYRRADLLARCLRSVDQHLVDSRIRVWDNHSDGSAEVRRLAVSRADVEWTFCTENVGFARAMNCLMAHVKSPTALLLNPDATLLSNLNRTRGWLADPKVAAAAPWVQNPHQQLWDNAHREPTLMRQVTSYLGWDNRVSRTPCLSSTYAAQPHVVGGYLSGAGLLVSMEAWRNIGIFDERYFLYGEEADWCRRARGAGWRLIAVPEPGIQHTAAGTVSDSVAVSTQSANLLRQNQERYLGDHHGKVAAMAFAVLTRCIDRVQPSKRRIAAARALAAVASARKDQDNSLAVLMVTAMYPSARDLVRGVVVSREVARLKQVGIRVRVVPKRPGWRGYLTQARRVRREAPGADVVHAQYGTSGFVAALLGGRRPLVITMHGSDIASGPRPRLDRYWLQYLLSIAGAARADRIIVQDVTMAGVLPRRLRAKVVVMGQAVDVPDLLFDASERAGVLFLSSRHRPVKRFWLAQAAHDLIRQRATLTSLDELAVKDIPRAMRQARVGVLTSEREGMPVAVKEALAAGLPVVSVDLPGLRELATEVPEGLTLTAHDAKCIAREIDRMLSRAPLSLRERERLISSLRRHGWVEPDRTERLVCLYRQLVGRSGTDSLGRQEAQPGP